MTMTRCWMLLTSWLLMIGCIPESQQLVIKHINVPSVIKLGEVNYVILDCDYDLENTSKEDLVVKWFLGNERTYHSLIYQWIQGRNPSADDSIRKYIDLTYKASNDPYTEYRAMKLNKPGIELSGDYTCVISTFGDEKRANTSMIIYARGEAFDIGYIKKNLKGNKESLEATCSAKGLYPQPTINFWVKGIQIKQPTKSTVTLRRDGFYDIVSRIEMENEELQTATFECILGIPKANYSVYQTTVYNSGTTTIFPAVNPQHNMGIQASKSDNGGGNFIDHTSKDFLLLLIHLLLFFLLH